MWSSKAKPIARFTTTNWWRLWSAWQTGRATLEALQGLGLVEPERANGSPRYRLAANARRRLNLTAEKTRVTQFDARQAEAQILAYLPTHAKITRGETAVLCQIGSSQAKRLLQRLVREGKLVQQQRGRSAWYGLSPHNTGAPKKKDGP